MYLDDIVAQSDLKVFFLITKGIMHVNSLTITTSVC